MGCSSCGKKRPPKKTSTSTKTTIKLKGRGNIRKRK